MVALIVDQLLEEIRVEFLMTQQLTGLAKADPRVLDAIASVPRDRFVPATQRRHAFGDHSLPIGYGQTISQPFIVALMSTLLRSRPDHVVLEIGTGSGYQTAVLSDLVEHVYSIEIIPELAARARADLSRMGYSNVTLACHDGSSGWVEHAPFDGILVTAAVDTIPGALREQLARGGRMIAPRNARAGIQQLILVQKDMDGVMHDTPVLDVRFVPLTH